MTLALLATPQGLDSAPLAKLVNTHCHSDHMGGNAAIQARYRCPVMLPQGDAPLIDAWDDKALLLGYCDHRAERFHYDEIIKPGEIHVWGGLEWRALAAPGHDMGALVFYNPEHRILISGDTLWHSGYGWVMPLEIDPRVLYTRGSPIWSVWMHVTDPIGMAIAQGVFVLAAFLCMIGLGTRVTTALTWFASLSYIHRNPQILRSSHSMTPILRSCSIARRGIAKFSYRPRRWRNFSARWIGLLPTAPTRRIDSQDRWRLRHCSAISRAATSRWAPIEIRTIPPTLRKRSERCWAA